MKQKNSLAGKLTTTADFTDIFAILFWVIPCKYVVIFLSDFTLSDFIFLFFFFPPSLWPSFLSEKPNRIPGISVKLTVLEW